MRCRQSHQAIPHPHLGRQSGQLAAFARRFSRRKFQRANLLQGIAAQDPQAKDMFFIGGGRKPRYVPEPATKGGFQRFPVPESRPV